MRETVISSLLVSTGLLFTLFFTSSFRESLSLPASSSADISHEDFYSSHQEIEDSAESSKVSFPLEHCMSKPQNDHTGQNLASSKTHHVLAGESLQNIAKLYNTTAEELVSLNELSTTRITVGQVLKLPSSSKKNNINHAQSNQVIDGSESDYHIVEKGQSPWHVAKKYKISLQRLLDMNELDESSARRIRVGDRLRVR